VDNLTRLLGLPATAVIGHRRKDETPVDIAVVIVAAGRGLRAGDAGGPGPKQYRTLGGMPVLERTLRVFHDHPGVGRIVAVTHEDDAAAYEAATARLDAARLVRIGGGATRQGSVAAS